MDGITADLLSPIERWRVWLIMAGQDVRIRYRRSLIGPFWVSISMATFVIGIGLLYSQVFNQPVREYLIYFGCGFLAWGFLVGLISEGASSVTEAEQHLRSIPMPIPLLVARAIWRNVVVFGHNVLVIMLMMLFFGHTLTPVALLAILGVAMFILFGFFLGITLAPLCTRYRDVALVITNLLQIMFFLTPIFWLPAATSERPFITDANPFHHLVSIVRQPLLGEVPSLLSYEVVGGLIVLTFLLALVSLAVSRKNLHLWL